MTITLDKPTTYRDYPVFHTDSPVIEGVAKALGALGEKPEEIAGTLYQAGIRGIRGNPQACAISRFVRTLDVAAGLDVETGGRVFLTDPKTGDIHAVQVSLAVQAFIACFDCGGFTELVDDINYIPIAQ